MSTQVQKPQISILLFLNEEGLAAILNPFITVCVNFGYPIKLEYSGVFPGAHVT